MTDQDDFQYKLDIALDKLIAARADRERALREYNEAAIRAAAADISIDKLIADNRNKEFK